MINRADYTKHYACLAAIFIIGDAVITLPDAYYGGAVLPGFLIASCFSVAIYFLSLIICRSLSGSGVFKRLFLTLFLLAAAVYALYNAARCLLDFLSFADKVLLPGGGHFAVAFIFIFTAAVLSVKKNDVILKLSLITAPFFVIAVIIFFLLTAKDFETENIMLNSMPAFKELRDGTMPYIFKTALPAVLLPPYFILLNKTQPRKGAGLWGLISGLVITALILCDSVLLFGARMSARLPFPLASAVSTVTVGPLFTRMDGIVYCLFFMSALIKTAFCAKLCFEALKKIKSGS